MIHFHANAEDIGKVHSIWERVCDGLKVNVLMVEYPGYGIYKGKPNAKQILEDSLIVFDFCVHKLNFRKQRIFAFGRSIGTGPASYLAAHRPIGLLCMMSGFSTISEAIKDMLGGIAKKCVKNHFDNFANLMKTKAPVLLIHGKKDKIIPHSHSVKLFKAFDGTVDLVLSKKMTHNSYSVKGNIIQPLKAFLQKIGCKQTYIRGGSDEPLCFPLIPHECVKDPEQC